MRPDIECWPVSDIISSRGIPFFIADLRSPALRHHQYRQLTSRRLRASPVRSMAHHWECCLLFAVRCCRQQYWSHSSHSNVAESGGRFYVRKGCSLCIMLLMLHARQVAWCSFPVCRNNWDHGAHALVRTQQDPAAARPATHCRTLWPAVAPCFSFGTIRRFGFRVTTMAG